MRIRIIHRAFSDRVECGCGFSQSATSASQTNAIINNHICQPKRKPRPNLGSRRAGR
jgi:hypothetical protein